MSGKREQKEDSTKPYLHGTARQLITCWQLKQSRAELCPASGGLEVGSAWPSQSSHLLRYQSSCHASAPPPLGSTLSLVHSLVPTVAVGASAIISAFQARGGKRGRKAGKPGKGAQGRRQIWDWWTYRVAIRPCVCARHPWGSLLSPVPHYLPLEILLIL